MACAKTEDSRWSETSLRLKMTSSHGTTVVAASSNGHQKGSKNIIQIYTDWANHYLEKSRFENRIISLQDDVTDGVIIADVIEAVTGKSVPNINRFPASRSHNVANVSRCLDALHSQQVCGVEDITAEQVVSGALKPILSLFFQLSRHKQLLQQLKQPNGRKLPSAAPAVSHIDTSGITPHSSLAKSIAVNANSSTKDKAANGEIRTRQSMLQKPTSLSNGASVVNSSTGAATQASRVRLSNTSRNAVSQSRPAPAAGVSGGGGGVTQQTNGATHTIAAPRQHTTIAAELSSPAAASPAIARPYGKTLPSTGSLPRRTIGASTNSSAAAARGQQKQNGAGIEPAASSCHTYHSASNGCGKKVYHQAASVATASGKSGVDSGCTDGRDNDGASGGDGGATLQRRSMLQQPRPRSSKLATACGGAGAIKRRSLAGSQTSLASNSSMASSIGGAVVGGKGGAAVASHLPRQQQRRINGQARTVTVALVSPMPKTPEPQFDAVVKPAAHERPSSTSSERACASASDTGDLSVYGDRSGDCEKLAAGKAKISAASAPIDEDFSVRPMQPLLRLARLPLARRTVHSTPQALVKGATPDAARKTGGDQKADTARANQCDSPPPDGTTSTDHATTAYDVQNQRATIRSAATRPNAHQFRYSSGETVSWRNPEIPAAAATDLTSSESVSSIQDRMTSACDKNLAHGDLRQSSYSQWRRVIESRRPSHGSLGNGSPEPSRTLRSSTPTGMPCARSRIHRASTPTSFGDCVTATQPRTSVPSPDYASLLQCSSTPVAAGRCQPDTDALNRPAATTARASPCVETTNSYPRPRSSSTKGCSGRGDNVEATGMDAGVHVLCRDHTTTTAAAECSSSRLDLPNSVKSYSIGGSTAHQLSESIRQRLRASDTVFSTITTAASRVIQSAAVTGCGGGEARKQCRPASSTYTGSGAALATRGSITGTESFESVGSNNVALVGAHHMTPAHMQRHLCSGKQPVVGSNCRMIGACWDSHQMAEQSPRLCRTNSIRSTNSERIYSSVSGGVSGGALRAAGLCNMAAQPDDPVYGYSLTAGSSVGARSSKGDDVHGSSLSLISNTSSIYSSGATAGFAVASASSVCVDDRQTHKTPASMNAGELRRLRRELAEAQQKVCTLSNQLTTNSQVVEAFEQSLASMTKKLQAMSSSGDHKDRQIAELRLCLERLHPAAAASLSGGNLNAPAVVERDARLVRAASIGSVSSQSSAGSGKSQHRSTAANGGGGKKKKKKGWFASSPQLRTSFGKAFSRKKSRHHTVESDDSASSGNLLQHASSAALKAGVAQSSASADMPVDRSVAAHTDKLRRELRERDSALTELRLETLAAHNQLQAATEAADRLRRDNERLYRLLAERSFTSPIRRSLTPTHVCAASAADTSVADVDVRYSSSSATVLDVAALVSTELNDAASEYKTLLVSDAPPTPRHKSPLTDCLATRRVTVAVAAESTELWCGSVGTQPGQPDGSQSCIIGSVHVDGDMSWTDLDGMVTALFQEHMQFILAEAVDAADGDSGLGDTVAPPSGARVDSYQLAGVRRHCAPISLDNNEHSAGVEPSVEDAPAALLQPSPDDAVLELTPSALDRLALHTLMPRDTAHRYLSAVRQHRRVLLYGAGGVLLRHVARCLAWHVLVSHVPAAVASHVTRDRLLCHDLAAAASLDQLQQLAAQLRANSCGNGDVQQPPQVFILENFRCALGTGRQVGADNTAVPAGRTAAVINELLACVDCTATYIIITGDEPCGSELLQFHADIHRLPCSTVQYSALSGERMLVRALRRRLTSSVNTDGEYSLSSHQRMTAIFDWIGRVWKDVNVFLIEHTSTPVLLDPELFLRCPSDESGSQAWFADTWNSCVLPHLARQTCDNAAVFGVILDDAYPWARRDGQLLRVPTGSPSSVPYGGEIAPNPEYPSAEQAGDLSTADQALKHDRPAIVGACDPLLEMIDSLQRASSTDLATISCTPAVQAGVRLVNGACQGGDQLTT